MTKFDDIIEDFEFLDDWDDRYKYVIDLGRSLPPYPEDKRNDDYKVRGCASQVWLTHSIDNANGENNITLLADSDAHIVRGLVAILLALYSGKSAKEILTLDPNEALKPLDLNDHLTPQRTNGFASMIAKVRALAKDYSTDQ